MQILRVKVRGWTGSCSACGVLVEIVLKIGNSSCAHVGTPPKHRTVSGILYVEYLEYTSMAYCFLLVNLQVDNVSSLLEFVCSKLQNGDVATLTYFLGRALNGSKKDVRKIIP